MLTRYIFRVQFRGYATPFSLAQLMDVGDFSSQYTCTVLACYATCMRSLHHAHEHAMSNCGFLCKSSRPERIFLKGYNRKVNKFLHNTL